MTYIIISCLLLLFIILTYSRNQRAKNKVVHLIETNCSACQRCVKICRHKAFESVKDETGIHILLKSPRKCTACGDCINACKFNALKLTDRKPAQRNIIL